MAGVTFEYVLPPKRDKPRPQKIVVIKRGRSREKDRVAKQIALGHKIQDMFESGAIENYRSAAAALHRSDGVIARFIWLTLLAPDIQERVLVGNEDISEATLRRVLASLDWDEQRALLAKELS